MPGEGGTAAATPMVTLRVELPDGDSTMTCESGDILRDVLLAEKVVASGVLMASRRPVIILPLFVCHTCLQHSRQRAALRAYSSACSLISRHMHAG